MTVAQDKRWRAELEIIDGLGKIPTCREMQKLLKSEKGMKVNHNTINADLKRDLETLTKDEYQNKKMGILAMVDNLISIANTIAETNKDDKIRLDAMNTVSKLQKTKTDILIKFRKANVEINKEDKPIFNVTIGKPREYAKENKI